MFKPLVFSTLVAALTAVRADPNPSEPGPGEVFNEGAACHIAWDPDTTGLWKNMSIELMTGSNTAMVHLTTVVTLDGTDPTNATFDYRCPQVTPNSAIYFYQFTAPGAADTLWTTRFAIADANGNTTPPQETSPSNPPGGQPILWGTGALVDPSSASPAPSKGTSNSTAPSGSSAPPAGASSASSQSVTPIASPPVTVSRTASSSKSSSASSPSGSITPSGGSNSSGATANANSAVGLSIDSKLLQAAVSLVAVAAAFAVAL